MVERAQLTTGMRLNDAAREAFVAPAASKTRSPSLLNLLAPSCSTKQGRQCLKQWLEQPCADPEVINQRRDTVDAVVSAVTSSNPVLWKLSSLFQHVQSYERELSVFTSSESSAVNNSIDAKLSLSGYSNLQKWLNELHVLVEDCLAEAGGTVELETLHSKRLHPILLFSQGFQPFCRLIGEVVTCLEQDCNATQFTAEIDNRKEMMSSALYLQELRTQIRQCEMEVAVALKQAANLLCIAEDRIKVLYADDEQSYITKMGIVLRVSRQDSHRIQQQNGSAVSIIRASKASGVWFSTPAIDLLGAKWKSLKRSYEDAEASLVDFLTFEFQTPYQEMLDKVACCIAELDVLVSFALVSHKHKFVRSSTSDLSSSLLLREIFDPFVQNGTGDGGDADASRIITIELSLDDGKSFLLLDGHLKSSHNNIVQLLGIIIILNQLGCFVPCKEAVLPVFDAIFLRTGAYDQQLYGFSTFMTEMRQMSHIFAAMTPNSLVLVEDLCRGTSTSEGLALALSMCFHLMESKTITCFSSQWRELTERLIVQPATATLAQIQPAIIDFGAGQSLNQSSQAEFEKLMRDCDLPQDLIALIHEEMKH